MAKDIARELDLPAPVPPAVCPVEDWLAFLGHRWNALLLWHLKGGARRHGELMALLPGISPKVLSQRLVALERRALVARMPAARFPREVRYALTPAAQRLVQVLDALELWAKAEAFSARRAFPVLR